MLRIRRNESPCDSGLMIEAEMYGAFRHVKIDAPADVVTHIADEAGHVGEWLFEISGRVYTASCGQKFTVLVPAGR